MWHQRFASMKTLSDTFPKVEESFLEMIRDICKGDMSRPRLLMLAIRYNIEDHEPCIRRLSTEDVALWVINYLLDGHGVESIGGDMSVSDYYPDAIYVNMGDTYDTTILYDYKSSKFVVTSWGDYVESKGDLT